MNNTSELYGWVSAAYRIATQSFGSGFTLSPGFRFWKHLEKKALFHDCLRTASPWLALNLSGFPVSNKFEAWPYLFDLSFGRPALFPPEASSRYVINLVACVQVWCPLCCKWSPHVFDSTVEPIQDAADATQCPFCDLHIWPWPSDTASLTQQASRPIALRPSVMSNILFLNPQPQEGTDHAETPEPQKTV